jgi:hypothetical protein
MFVVHDKKYAYSIDRVKQMVNDKGKMPDVEMLLFPLVLKIRLYSFYENSCGSHRYYYNTRSCIFYIESCNEKHTGCYSECSVVQRHWTASSSYRWYYVNIRVSEMWYFLQKGNNSSCIVRTVWVCVFLFRYCSLRVTQDRDQTCLLFMFPVTTRCSMLGN